MNPDLNPDLTRTMPDSRHFLYVLRYRHEPGRDLSPLKRGTKSWFVTYGMESTLTALAKTHPETRCQLVHGPTVAQSGEPIALNFAEIATPTRLKVNGFSASLMPNRARHSKKWAFTMGQGVL